MELCPFVSMRVDGIMYLPYHDGGHGSSSSVKSNGNGLVLTHLLNMANTAQETTYSFGDFSGLPPEEQDIVEHILHGANLEVGQKKIEFPWDKDGSMQIDSIIDYDSYNGSPPPPPPPPPSVVPVATLYSRSGPVPHIPHGAAIFPSPLVPLVFTPQINRTSTVGPPPGMIPIGLTMVNHDFAMSPPTEAPLEVVNSPTVLSAASNQQMVAVHGGSGGHSEVATSVVADMMTEVPAGDSSYESSKTPEEYPSSGAEVDVPKTGGEGSKSGDLKSQPRRYKKVRPKDYYKKFEDDDDDDDDIIIIKKGVESTSNDFTDNSGQSKQDCDIVPSGKLRKDSNAKRHAQMLDTISFFDTEISENGILPNETLPLELLKNHYILKFSDQKDNSSHSEVNVEANSVPVAVQSDIVEPECQDSNKPIETDPSLDCNNCDTEIDVPQEKEGGEDDDFAETEEFPEPSEELLEYPSAVVGENSLSGLDQESSDPAIAVDVTTDADSVNSTEKVETVPLAELTSDETATTDTAITTEVSAAPTQPKLKMSWAGLFRNTVTTSKSIVVYSDYETSSSNNGVFASGTAASSPTPAAAVRRSSPVTSSSQKASPERQFVKEPSPQLQAPVSVANDNLAKEIGDVLKSFSPTYRPVALQPRGLINKGNWCYINATLQALLSCPPFYHLMKRLPLPSTDLRGPSSTPVLDTMFRFMSEFNAMPNIASKKRPASQELIPGSPFEPSYVYKMLHMIESTMSFKFGKQEDAEEFLSFVLNRLHEEMLAVVNLENNSKYQESDTNHNSKPKENGFLPDVNANVEEDPSADDEWEQVGPKNKSVYTRRANFARSCVSDIFTGQMRSAVYQIASKESATLQPFFTLQLDIQSEKIWNVKDALEGLVSREAVHGYTCSKTNTEVEITKRLTLEELPPVLILHFKCFVYDKNGGIQKVLKRIDYPVDLDISKDLLSPIRSRMPPALRNYKLFAVLFHHGKNASGGHYTTDAYHSGINSWVRYDDSTVRQVPIAHVLKFVPNRIPYLLFYRRCDLS